MNVRIVLILCLIVTVARFALDSYLPSLPAIAAYFHANAAQTQLTLTFYLIGFGGSQILYGPLSERYGRRKIILFGLSLFLLGSTLCAIAPSLNWLIFFRFIAGFGAGAGPALKRAIAADHFSGITLVKVWARTTNALVLTLIIAPVIGGYIQEWFGWRENFLIATGYGAMILAIIYWFLPETNANRGKHSLAVTSIMQNYWQLLADRQYLGYTLASALSFSGLIAYFQLSPFLLINALRLSPSIYGWLSLWIAFSYLAGGAIASKLASRIDTLGTLFIGILLLIAGGITMLIPALFQRMNLALVLGPTIIFVIGTRIIVPSAAAGSLSAKSGRAGYASALIGVLQLTCSALTSSIISRFYERDQILLASTFTILGVLTLLVFWRLIGWQEKTATKNIEDHS